MTSYLPKTANLDQILSSSQMTTEFSETYLNFKTEVAEIKAANFQKEVDDLTFYENLTSRWEALTQTNSDSQGMGNYSLTKAKKGCGLFLIHEHQGEDLFKEMPFLNEFRKEKVFKGVKDKSLRAPKTVKVPSKCVDSQGNQMGCKSPYSLLTTFSVSALRHS